MPLTPTAIAIVLWAAVLAGGTLTCAILAAAALARRVKR